MKNFGKFKRILTIGFALMLTFSSIGLSGCNKSSKSDPNVIVDKVSKGELVHNAKVVKTEENMFFNGTSEYQIVYPDDVEYKVSWSDPSLKEDYVKPESPYTPYPDGYVVSGPEGNLTLPETELKISSSDDETIIRAVSELHGFIWQATGVGLHMVTDKNRTYTEDVKYISVGETQVLKDSGLNLDLLSLKGNGFYIKSKGNCIFIVGGDDFGSLYGVYEFLKYQFNYEYYGPDTWEIDKGLTSSPLCTWDVKEVPDIKYRSSHMYDINYDRVNARRMRMRKDHEMIGRFGGWNGHNTFLVLPLEEYDNAKKPETYHPDWYTEDKTQLCYTAHGNKTEYNALVEIVAEKMKQFLIDNPKVDIIPFTHRDHNTWCACKACNKIMAENAGAAAATQTLYINDVADIVIPWAKENFPNREVYILVFAYQKTVPAPVVKGSNGDWQPVSEDMVFSEGVCAWYAPWQARFYYPFNSTENQRYWDYMEQWDVLTNKFFVWFYGCRFADYFIPYDTMTNLQSTIKYLVEKKTELFFIQGQWDSQSSDWSRLKVYLQAKLMWDCNLDFNELVENFFINYYGPAAQDMLDFYTYYRYYMAYCNITYGFDNVPEQGTYVTKSIDAFNETTMLKWLSFCDKGYAALEDLKVAGDPRYQLYYDHINLDSLSATAMMLTFNSAYYESISSTKRAEVNAKFLQDCAYHKITGAINR